MARRYGVPAFLAAHVDQDGYERWLRRKAAAHLKRDRLRHNIVASGESYRLAIHGAVARSEGRDLYTGENLAWELISTWDNELSTLGDGYKAGFGLLPTVDHVGDGRCEGDFRICAWRTNDAKSDLAYADFVALCRRVVEYHDTALTLGNYDGDTAGTE